MKTNMADKKGMTLIELLVYIGLAALLLAPLLMLMQNSSFSMARDAVSTGLRISGRDVLNIIYDDLKNTGFKIITLASPPEYDVTVDPKNVTANLRDSSSFAPVDHVIAGSSNNGPYDSLTILKGVLNDVGTWVGWDSIKYSVRAADSALIRTATNINPTGTISSGPTTTVLAGNVDALQFQYSDNLERWANTCGPGVVVGTETVVGCVSDPPSDGNFDKKNVKYIKVYLVMRDNKKVGATQTAPAITVANYTVPAVNSPISRERYEMVVPIPNNGLFP